MWMKSMYIGLYKTPNKALPCLVLSWANREGVHRPVGSWFFFFFIFSFFFFFNCFTPFYSFSLTTEPDPRLHRPFHIGTFLPSRVKQVVFLETYSGWKCCIAFQNRTYIEIRARLLKFTDSNCICQLYSALRLKDQSK